MSQRDDPLQHLIEDAYGQWSRQRLRGQGEKVTIERELDGRPATIVAKTTSGFTSERKHCQLDLERRLPTTMAGYQSSVAGPENLPEFVAGVRKQDEQLGRRETPAQIPEKAAAAPSGGPSRRAALLPDEALTDHEALARALSSFGIPAADALVRDHAEPAFRLDLAGDEEQAPAAILHGRGLLPPGEPWPHSDGGRALAFLAGIDLSRLRPALPGAQALPDAGWMLFFADVDDPTGYDPDRWNEPQPEPDGWEQGEFYGEPTENVPGANARIFWVEPGVAPIAGDPPGLRGSHGPAEERRIAIEQLTLPDGWGVARDRFGLSRDQAEVYDALVGDLRYWPTATWRDDWVLGPVTGAQGEPSDDGSILLIHLGSVAFQDGGAIQFRISPEALAAHDWSQVYARGDSC